jgi:hypothetical protein
MPRRKPTDNSELDLNTENQTDPPQAEEHDNAQRSQQIVRKQAESPSSERKTYEEK